MADKTKQDKTSRWRLALGYPILSGVLMAAAFPPLPLGFLACISLLPLIPVAENLRGRVAFGAGFLQGIIFYSATIYWIAWITPPGMAGAIFYMAVFRGVFVYLWSAMWARYGWLGLWLTPFSWVGFEYFNTLGDMGFPWMVLGHSQVDYLPLIQIAEVTGVYGVSFWVVVVNLIAYEIIRNARRGPMIGVLVSAFAAPLGFGLWRASEPLAEGDLNVAIVQQNVSPVEKSHWGFDHNFDALKPLTIDAAKTGARLIVWSEAAVPAYLQSDRPLHDATYQARVQALVDSLGIYLYTGANRYEAATRDRHYNSSFLFKPGGGELPHYDKVKVVPFGERAPFPEVLGFLRDIRWSGGGYVSGDFEGGIDRTVFTVPGGRFSGVICFDSAFPWLARELVLHGAEFLVVITNDGWYKRTSAPYQHAAIATFRAIENRRWVVRCANTGMSLFVDPHGRQWQNTGLFHTAVLERAIAPRKDQTLYVRFGDLFARGCGLIALMGLALAFIRRRDKAAEERARPKGTVPALAPPDRELPEDGKPMPFLDHLEELRWRILKGLSAIIAGAVACGIFVNDILALLIHPARTEENALVLQTLKPMGMFMVKLEIVLVGGAIIALPFLMYQIWIFVSPGLFAGERRFITFVIASSTACFAVGAVLAYWLVIPLAIAFFVGMTVDTAVMPQFDIGMYIGFVLRLIVVFGLVFELPVVTFFLAKVGIATSSRMRTGRRYAILIGFVLAAILTPPDPLSQLLMALPLVVLYEASIWVARIVNE